MPSVKFDTTASSGKRKRSSETKQHRPQSSLNTKSAEYVHDSSSEDNSPRRNGIHQSQTKPNGRDSEHTRAHAANKTAGSAQKSHEKKINAETAAHSSPSLDKKRRASDAPNGLPKQKTQKARSPRASPSRPEYNSSKKAFMSSPALINGNVKSAPTETVSLISESEEDGSKQKRGSLKPSQIPRKTSTFSELSEADDSTSQSDGSRTQARAGLNSKKIETTLGLEKGSEEKEDEDEEDTDEDDEDEDEDDNDIADAHVTGIAKPSADQHSSALISAESSSDEESDSSERNSPDAIDDKHKSQAAKRSALLESEMEEDSGTSDDDSESEDSALSGGVKAVERPDTSTKNVDLGRRAKAEPKSDNKARDQASSASHSESGAQSDTDSSTTPPASTPTAEKVVLGHDIRRTTQYELPLSFKKMEIALDASSTALTALDVEALFDKELWHFTAPASLPLTSIEEVALPKLTDGSSVMTHDDIQYALVSQTVQDAEFTCLLPSVSDSLYKDVSIPFKKHFQLQKMLRLPSHILYPSADSSKSKSKHSTPVNKKNEQPDGLRMRDHGFGIPGASISEGAESCIRGPLTQRREQFHTPIEPQSSSPDKKRKLVDLSSDVADSQRLAPGSPAKRSKSIESRMSAGSPNIPSSAHSHLVSTANEFPFPKNKRHHLLSQPLSNTTSDTSRRDLDHVASMDLDIQDSVQGKSADAKKVNAAPKVAEQLVASPSQEVTKSKRRKRKSAIPGEKEGVSVPTPVAVHSEISQPKPLSVWPQGDHKHRESSREDKPTPAKKSNLVRSDNPNMPKSDKQLIEAAPSPKQKESKEEKQHRKAERHQEKLRQKFKVPNFTPKRDADAIESLDKEINIENRLKGRHSPQVGAKEVGTDPVSQVIKRNDFVKASVLHGSSLTGNAENESSGNEDLGAINVDVFPERDLSPRPMQKAINTAPSKQKVSKSHVSKPQSTGVEADSKGVSKAANEKKRKSKDQPKSEHQGDGIRLKHSLENGIKSSHTQQQSSQHTEASPILSAIRSSEHEPTPEERAKRKADKKAEKKARRKAQKARDESAAADGGDKMDVDTASPSQSPARTVPAPFSNVTPLQRPQIIVQLSTKQQDQSTQPSIDQSSTASSPPAKKRKRKDKHVESSKPELASHVLTSFDGPTDQNSTKHPNSPPTKHLKTTPSSSVLAQETKKKNKDTLKTPRSKPSFNIPASTTQPITHPSSSLTANPPPNPTHTSPPATTSAPTAPPTTTSYPPNAPTGLLDEAAAAKARMKAMETPEERETRRAAKHQLKEHNRLKRERRARKQEERERRTGSASS